MHKPLIAPFLWPEKPAQKPATLARRIDRLRVALLELDRTMARAVLVRPENILHGAKKPGYTGRAAFGKHS